MPLAFINNRILSFLYIINKAKVNFKTAESVLLLTLTLVVFETALLISDVREAVSDQTRSTIPGGARTISLHFNLSTDFI